MRSSVLQEDDRRWSAGAPALPPEPLPSPPPLPDFVGEADEFDANWNVRGAQSKPHAAATDVAGAQSDLPTLSAGDAAQTAVVTVIVENALDSNHESLIPHSADYSLKISPHFKNQPFMMPCMSPPALSRAGSLEKETVPAFAVPKNSDDKTMDAEIGANPANVVLTIGIDELHLLERVARVEEWLKEMRAEQQRFAHLEVELKEMTAEHQRQLDDLSRQIRGWEGPLVKGTEPTAVKMQVGKESATLGNKRRPSVIASSLMALEEETDEREEHELAFSMWDACLFLGCEDKANLKGESMQVGAAVTIFGLLALLVNGLIQSAIVAVVVIKMAADANIDENTAADMRCSFRGLSNPHLPKLLHVRVQGLPCERSARPR